MKTTIAGILMLILIVTGCKKDRNKSYSVMTDQSSITWKGSSPVTENTGTFTVNGNNLIVKNGKVINGTFNIPINSINVTNLPPDLKPQLTQHLLSPDFFNVALYPLAVFKIQKVETYSGPQQEGSVANANSIITGSLTMIGVTKAVAFPAKLTMQANQLKAEAFLEINRTDWGMNYAADPALGEHHILPMVKLEIKLVAVKN